MPIYAFVDNNGAEVESFFSFDDVPSIGDKVEIDGVECTRVASFILDTAGIERKTHKYPYVSRSLPRNLSGVGNYDKQGRPVIRSQAHERNVASEHGYVKE
tara:strand:+ start:9878 stop:10180 length:303 start_codon:yes stop_codon:yes gene_type:complete